MADSDSDEFSDEEFYNHLPFDLDLAEINEEQKIRADGLLHDHQADSDYGEIEDDDNLPLFYHRRPEFEWTGGHTITETVYDRFVTLLIG